MYIYKYTFINTHKYLCECIKSILKVSSSTFHITAIVKYNSETYAEQKNYLTNFLFTNE